MLSLHVKEQKERAKTVQVQNLRVTLTLPHPRDGSVGGVKQLNVSQTVSRPNVIAEPRNRFCGEPKVQTRGYGRIVYPERVRHEI